MVKINTMTIISMGFGIPVAIVALINPTDALLIISIIYACIEYYTPTLGDFLTSKPNNVGRNIGKIALCSSILKTAFLLYPILYVMKLLYSN